MSTAEHICSGLKAMRAWYERLPRYRTGQVNHSVQDAARWINPRTGLYTRLNGQDAKGEPFSRRR
jgi:hypothetical protein